MPGRSTSSDFANFLDCESPAWRESVKVESSASQSLVCRRHSAQAMGLPREIHVADRSLHAKRRWEEEAHVYLKR